MKENDLIIANGPSKEPRDLPYSAKLQADSELDMTGKRHHPAAQRPPRPSPVTSCRKCGVSRRQLVALACAATAAERGLPDGLMIQERAASARAGRRARGAWTARQGRCLCGEDVLGAGSGGLGKTNGSGVLCLEGWWEVQEGGIVTLLVKKVAKVYQ